VLEVLAVVVRQPLERVWQVLQIQAAEGGALPLLALAALEAQAS
jgi:hypothetical protein